MENEDKCPKCGAKLEKKVSIKDYSYMYIFKCENCRHKKTQKPVSI